ncbi:MAG: TetR/AcrR family transcriptional regulator [Actinomycetota bacterium]|nr:TetR/AcrR family transcriptional regulator [Actinomycetota bacterium]
MPRTREFEPETALQDAMELFWLKGYEATSMRDLLEGMGIGRGSFYGTFGDKRSLFLAALDRFERTRTAWIPEVLQEGDSPVEAIRYVFERSVKGLVSFEPRRGCLLANTAVELGPHDPEVAKRISGHVRRTEDAFEDALVRARASGEISEEQDPKALARFLVTNLHGLRVMARAGADRETLQDTVEVALGALR